MIQSSYDAAAALDIPPGPLSRAQRVSLDGEESSTSDVAAQLLLTQRNGEPDGLAVAHVLLAGPQPQRGRPRT
jgi:hypothetical protein